MEKNLNDLFVNQEQLMKENKKWKEKYDTIQVELEQYENENDSLKRNYVKPSRY